MAIPIEAENKNEFNGIVGLVHTASMTYADFTTVTIPWGPDLTGLTL